MELPVHVSTSLVVCLQAMLLILIINVFSVTKNLTTPTTDRIELRLCLNSEGAYVNVALELLEVYVQ